MNSEAFTEAYQRLNPEQKKAVDTIEGPVMVVAGPGTGKTQVLTLRIANIVLQTDIAPENILALTFTDSAVHNMRKRLVSLMGSAGYRPVIKTFHGFANDIIQKYGEEFQRMLSARSVTDLERIELLQDIILNLPLQKLKPFGDTFHYVGSLNQKISELKREGITPTLFSDIIEKTKSDFEHHDDLYHEKGKFKGKMKGKYLDLKKNIEKNEELLKVYTAYEQGLREKKWYDYDDMILEVVRAFREDEELLLRMQEEYQYVLVDEHQDSNNAQNEMLELLVNHFDSPNLFVVGDEKQSIFRFQGASLENFYYFKHRYPSAELITLHRNYRSTQVILDAVQSVLPSHVPLLAEQNQENVPIGIAECATEHEEYYFIGQCIQKLLDQGTPAHEIAVLYAKNAEGLDLADAFSRMGIPVIVESNINIFHNPIIKKLLTLLQAIDKKADDTSLLAILYLDIFDVTPLDIMKLTRSASQKHTTTLWEIMSDKKLVSSIKLDNATVFFEISSLVSSWIKLAYNHSLRTLIQRVLRESGLLQSCLADSDRVSHLDAIDIFFEQIKEYEQVYEHMQLSDLFKMIQRIEEHQIPVKNKKRNMVTGYVRAMTAHKSKGLEFEHVFIMHTVDGVWGNARKADKLPLIEGVYRLTYNKKEEDMRSLDDARRLFYVAVTRAKYSLTISYAIMRNDGRVQTPSQFIHELDSRRIQKIDTTQLSGYYETAQFTEHKNPFAIDASVGIKNLIKELFLKQGLSATALNNYLESPWKFLFRNLLRLPSVQTPSQEYGQAIHSALEDLFKMLSTEQVTLEWFLDRFSYYLKQKGLLQTDFQRWEDRGYDALTAWYQAHHHEWKHRTVTERSYQVQFDSVSLKGKIDRLDFIEGDRVVVTDYKTGKPRTRNEILGQTKNSTGDYHRQLVFYGLLLRYYDQGKYSMDKAVLDFIEPDKSGKLHREEFEISADEIDALEVVLHRVIDEILHVKFWNTPIDADDDLYPYVQALLK